MFWQRTHRRRMEELIRSARTDFPVSQEYVERVTAAIEEAPAAARARSRRRLVAVAAGVLVALVGLGFVPFPAGSAKGALDRALAAAENAASVHIVTWSRSPDGRNTADNDEWLTEDGFSRREGWDNGRPCFLTLVTGPWELYYSPGRSKKPGAAQQVYVPCNLHPTPMPDRELLQRRLGELRGLAADAAHPDADMDIRERRETRLWGGTVDVVEAQVTTAVDQWCCSKAGHQASLLPKGTRELIRAEVDAVTGRILSFGKYFLAGRRWRQMEDAKYEWDVEVPEELKSFDLPAGTKLTRGTWWEHRVEQVMAQADTRDWTVTLHAIDIERNGDIVLSVSRVVRPDSEMLAGCNQGWPLVAHAAGSGGERYRQDNTYSCYNARHSGYWTTTLMPENRDAHPRSVTLTIWPYQESPSEDQSVTFRGIPVPPRQDVDDVMAAAREVIQY